MIRIAILVLYYYYDCVLAEVCTVPVLLVCSTFVLCVQVLHQNAEYVITALTLAFTV